VSIHTCEDNNPSPTETDKVPLVLSFSLDRLAGRWVVVADSMGPRNFVAPLTPTQQKAIAIVPKLCSVPSFLGACLVLWRILHSKSRLGRIYHRILAVMSVTDVVFSLWTFASTWSIPHGTFGVYGAVGNTQTCSIAGFIGQGSGLTSIMYNGSLASFFVLSVRWGWSEKHLRRLEPWFHLIPLVFGWGTAIAGIPLKLYNSIGINCWIAEYPFGCEDSRRHDGQTTCLRGDNAWIYRWAFYHAELWAVWGFCVLTMIVLYRHIRQNEIRSDRYRLSRRKWLQSKDFAGQAIFFTGVFCITWIWSLVQWVLQQQTGKVRVMFQVVFHTPDSLVQVWK
jgi:hypothetical protein